MANRFLETNFYKSPFVRSLKGSLKALYGFIICDCNSAGIWSLDLEVAGLYIGFPVTMDEFDECFIKKGKAVDIGGGRYFFPDFIEHQYPKGFQEKNPAHINVIKELKKFNLIDENLVVISLKNKAPSKPLQSPIGNGYGKGNGNGNGNGLKDEGLGETIEPTKNIGRLVNEMHQYWIKEFPHYTVNHGTDTIALVNICSFMVEQAKHEKADDPNDQKMMLDTFKLVANYIKTDGSWWQGKSLKTISGNMQDFYNAIKLGKNGNSKQANGRSKKSVNPTTDDLQEAFHRRYSE